MFNECAIGQHLLDNFMCTKNYSDKKFAVLLFGHSFFICLFWKPFTSSHLKKICLQLENLAQIKCFDPLIKHPIIFVHLYWKIN